MNFVRQLFKQLRSGISRYIVAFYGSCVLFLLTAYLINTGNNEDMVIRIILATIFAIAVSITAQTLSFRYKFSKRNDIIQKIASALTAVPCFFLVSDLDDPYVMLGYTGIVTAIFAAAVYFLFTAINENTILPYLLKNILFAGFIALIFFGGISLCVLAVHYLIYEFSDLSEYIITVLAFSFEVLFLNLFLSGIYNSEEDLHIPKAFKVLVLYVAFPIYWLLIAVLYVYLGKILITMNMPGGQINLFASFAALFFIFFRFTVMQYDHKIIKTFASFGGYTLIPIMIAQAIAVYIRLNAYGITPPRYASIILTAVALIFVIVSLIRRGKYIKQVILVFIGACILVSVTPLNLIDVPVYQQTARLEKILERNNMLSNDTVVPGTDISDEDKADIRGSYDFLIHQEKAPAYLKQNKEFSELFGFENDGYTFYRYFNFYGSIPLDLNITGYSRLWEINAEGKTSSGPFIVKVNNTEYDISDFVLTLSNEVQKEAAMLRYDLTDDIVIFFKTIDCSIKSDNTFEYYHYSGFALMK